MAGRRWPGVALKDSFQYPLEGYTEINIRTLEVIGGSLPRRALNMTIEWAIEHREELMEDWNLCQSKQHPKRIKPLE